jgi:uncharacterized membrane protein YesL
VWAGLKAWWRGIAHFNQRGYAYIWANVIWFVLSLPLITAPAAWAGLVKMTHRAQSSPTTDLRDVWEGFKENLVRGIIMAALNALVIGINVWNLLAYRYDDGATVIALRVVWLTVLFVWLTVQVYMWPLFYEMEHPTLFGAMRNAFVMLLLNPIFTIGLWVGLVILIAFSMVFPVAWMLLTVGMLAAIANTAVLDRLRTVRYNDQNLSDSTIGL